MEPRAKGQPIGTPYESVKWMELLKKAVANQKETTTEDTPSTGQCTEVCITA